MPRFFTKQQLYQDLPHSGSDTEPVEVLLSWSAPTRPFRKKDRSYYTTIAILVILLILIALLAKEILLVGVVLAVAFVVYVLGFVPPDEVEYKLSTQGISIGDHFYFWLDCHSFWFEEREGHSVLHVLTQLRFPAMLMIMLGEQNEERVKQIVAKYLPFHEIPPKGWLDRWADSLKKHFPLENPHK